MLALLLGMTTAGAADRTAPRLRVTDRVPLSVAGEHFGARERVTVTAITGLGPRSVRVRAVSGRFRAEFDKLPTSGCGAPYAVRARGATGTIAVVKLGPPRPCIPPPRD
jgi:hypothetical protein